MSAPRLLPVLPALGAPLAGGLYAGVTTGTDGALYALILLADKPAKRLNWKSATAWATDLQASLPSRPEGALLFANLQPQFEDGWHWLGEQYSADDAWSQLFNSGYQGNNYKKYEARARAVRRLPLESFCPSEAAEA